MNKRDMKIILGLTIIHFLISFLLHTIAWVYALSATTILEEIIVWAGTAIGFPIFYFWAEVIGKEFLGGTGLLFLFFLNSLLWISTIYMILLGLRRKRTV